MPNPFNRNALPVLAALALTACASTPTRDLMCAEMVRFANGVHREDVREVVLTTDWGGVWSAEQDLMFEKTCRHEGTRAGKKMCAYLMKNTSTEFAAENINRALDCISAPHIPESNGRPDSSAARYQSSSVPGLKPGVELGVEYSYGQDDRPPMLKIDAGRK
jgi:hypothetical protein